MIKTVVVPLDGSERAEAALAPASWLSVRLGADLLVVTSTFAVDPGPEEAILERGLRLTTSPRASTKVLRGHHAARAIVDAARSTPEALICMSTTGKGALATRLLGSVADQVLALGRTPVVLIGPGCKPWSGVGDGAVVCVEQASDPRTRVARVGTLPLELGLTVHTVTVHLPNREWTTGSPTDAAEWTAEVLRHRGVDAIEHDLADNDVAPAILALVREVDARFLAIAANHPSHGGGDRPFGRVGSELVRESPCPIIVQHLPAEG
jgi:nucleotide-binding universal stress UspA family protein